MRFLPPTPGWRAFLKNELGGVLGSELREALEEGWNELKGLWARRHKPGSGRPTGFTVTPGSVSLDSVKIPLKSSTVLCGLYWAIDQRSELDKPFEPLPGGGRSRDSPGKTLNGEDLEPQAELSEIEPESEVGGVCCAA
jgi:hypothetical protein